MGPVGKTKYRSYQHENIVEAVTLVQGGQYYIQGYYDDEVRVRQ